MTDCGRIRDKAIEEAERLGHTGIGCEHLLLGVLADEQGMARTVLGSHGVTLGAARDSVDQMVGSGWRGNVRWTLSPRATVVERLAEVEAERLGARQPGGEHVSIAMINEGGSGAVSVLMELGVNLRQLRTDLVRAVPDVPREVQERYLRERETYELAQREEGGRYGWWQLPPGSG